MDIVVRHNQRRKKRVSEPKIVEWSIRKIMLITLVVSCTVMFIVDPYGWIPEPDKSPCKKEDTRPRCLGKIKFFWQ
jgi:hypothetical protein